MRFSTVESPLVRAYRELLGVPPNTGADDLKKAYHRLALLYHPDRNSDADAAADFQKVRTAYLALSDSGRVRDLNQNHRRERMQTVVVEGLNVTVGSFFGHRSYQPRARVARALRIGREKTGEHDVDGPNANRPPERDHSILDDPAFDAIEVVYAGKFSVGDEERLQTGLSASHARQLPWLVINNRGIAYVLEQDFERALACFTELDERIPNNIIFTYRRGLCHVVLGFRDQRRSLFGVMKPNVAEVERGLKLLRRAVALGESRTIGKQKCLVIRKLIADTLDKLGRRRQAAKRWREIAKLQPRSREAADRTGTVVPAQVTGRKY